MCPLFRASPRAAENRLSGSQGGKAFVCCDGHDVAGARPAPPVRQAQSLVPVWPGAEGRRRLPGLRLRGLCLMLPGSLRSLLRSPHVCAMKSDAGDALLSPAAQARGPERGGGCSQLVSWRSPEEAAKVLPTPLAGLSNEHQVQGKQEKKAKT